MARPAKIAAALLIEDLDFYPRATVDSSHVGGMAAALEAGAELPPIIADRKSKRIVDGWHRRRAVLKARGPDAEVEVFWRDYDSDAEMFEEAVALNATHGRKLTTWDHSRIKVRAGELGLNDKQVAVMIHRTEGYVETRLVTATRTAVSGKEPTRLVALKRPLRQFAGESLTPEQEAANEHSSGWSPSFHAHQLIMLIEAQAVEMTDDLAETLARLRDLLDGLA